MKSGYRFLLLLIHTLAFFHWTDLASAQQVRALVIGIDAYSGDHAPLGGAVADARDLESALVSFGATDIRIVLNAEATRRRIETEWKQLVEISAPGDTIFFTYAGHGAQVPEMLAGDEVDGLDEIILLASHGENGPSASEAFLDNELSVMFADATGRGIRVVAIMDTCHGGTLWRSVSGVAVRSSSSERGPTLPTQSASRVRAAGPALETAPIEGLVYIGAAQDDQVVPEFPIGGKPRGALSATIAKLLRSTEDTVTYAELVTMIRRGVRSIAERHQIPNIAATLEPSEVALSRAGVYAPQVQAAASGSVADAAPEEATISLFVSGLADDMTQRLFTLNGVARSPTEAGADLHMNFACGAVRTPDLVHSPGLSMETARNFIERWRLIRSLQQYDGSGMSLAWTSQEGAVPFGDVVTLTVDALPYRFLTVFALAGDGTVFNLYPDPARGEQSEAAAALLPRFDFKSSPPGGQDHLVVISSDAPLSVLHAALTANDQMKAPGVVQQALVADQKGKNLAIDVIGLVTGEIYSCD